MMDGWMDGWTFRRTDRQADDRVNDRMINRVNGRQMGEQIYRKKGKYIKQEIHQTYRRKYGTVFYHIMSITTDLKEAAGA